MVAVGGRRRDAEEAIEREAVRNGRLAARVDPERPGERVERRQDGDDEREDDDPAQLAVLRWYSPIGQIGR